MEIIKDLYKRLLDRYPAPHYAGLPVCTGPDFKKKEKIQKIGFLRISLFPFLSICLGGSKPAQNCVENDV
jgi:hypothetical protein